MDYQRLKHKVLSFAIAETAYAVWRARNGKVHGADQVNLDGWREICKIIAVRCAKNPFLKKLYLKMDRRL